MVIGPGGPIQGPGPVDKNKLKPAEPKPVDSSRKPDTVELSLQAKLKSQLSSVPDVRQDRINQLKQEIESGKFDTKERLQNSTQRFLEENRDLV